MPLASVQASFGNSGCVSCGASLQGIPDSMRCGECLCASVCASPDEPVMPPLVLEQLQRQERLRAWGWDFV